MKKMICVLMCLVFFLTGCGSNVTEKTVTVYFPDENVMYVEGEERVIKGENEVDFVKAVFAEILKGPESERLNPSLRGDVKLLSVNVDKGICTVDLSEEFALYNTGGSAMESMAIYSIVNSVCSLEGIDKVKINIEGNSEAEFGGHFYMGEPFEPDVDLVK